ncbi:MAG: TlyA family RNA methyltransferase [Desulfobulbaceae bacterium]|nr:TlyA family RNA methyltransferase [Desulfobulbaceae bacterium]
MASKRLDALVIEHGIADHIDIARALIGAGRILVNGQPGTKAGNLYHTDSVIDLKDKQTYVSRAGAKLAAGLEQFGINPRGMICADIGCSTGGFTDCLLRHGAARVYSVDVGYGILDWKLRNDERVVVLERTNARYLTNEQIPEPLDLVVIDASFISLRLLLKPVCRLFAGDKRLIIALVKPQFELAREKVPRGGVVREESLHDEALEMVRGYAAEAGLSCGGVARSPVAGARGNVEFLMHLAAKTNGKRQEK